MKKYLLIALGAGLLGAGIYAYYLYNKPNRDVAAAAPDVTVTASELFDAFVQDTATANHRFNDKVLQITGEVLSADTSDRRMNIVFKTNVEDGTVSCQLNPEATAEAGHIEAGAKVTVKGECDGFMPDMLGMGGGEVSITRAVLVK
jgi:hypothetical protein